jgi:hypothetical protein
MGLHHIPELYILEVHIQRFHIQEDRIREVHTVKGEIPMKWLSDIERLDFQHIVDDYLE